MRALLRWVLLPLIATLSTAIVVRGQSPPEPPITVRLQMVAYHLGILGGRALHIPDVHIDQILSPQSFTVRPRHDKVRGLVLLERAGMRGLVPGVEVELWGRAYTLAGASVELGWPPNLTREAVAGFRRVPVIQADAVRTPGGVVLY